MLRHGTTFCEAKTGYGLDLANEKKQLRALLKGAKGHPVGVAPTALPAHEVPPELRGSSALKRRYVEEGRAEILPALADGGARFVDVFCEEGVFSIEESRAILEAGEAVGLQPRVHADELTPRSTAATIRALQNQSSGIPAPTPKCALPVVNILVRTALSCPLDDGNTGAPCRS